MLCFETLCMRIVQSWRCVMVLAITTTCLRGSLLNFKCLNGAIKLVLAGWATRTHWWGCGASATHQWFLILFNFLFARPSLKCSTNSFFFFWSSLHFWCLFQLTTTPANKSNKLLQPWLHYTPICDGSLSPIIRATGIYKEKNRKKMERVE